MKSKTLVILIIVIAALVIIKIFFLQNKNSAPKQGVSPKGQTAMVSGYVVQPQQLENIIYSSGTVLANEEVELRPEVSGKLVSVLFAEGTVVNKGDLLVKINDVDLQAQLKKLEIQYKLAKERESRLKGLLDIKGVSQEEYDVTSNHLQTIGADMDYTRAQIAKTEIRAPFTGKIGLKNVSEGSFVNNTNVIASMQQTAILKIDFTIPEKYAAIITVGDSVKFNVEGSKEKFIAKVSAIEPKIDAETRNIKVRALYDNAASKVYPGAFAKVEVVSGKRQSSLMVPTEAVIPELKGKKVFISKGGKAMPVKIETGIRSSSLIEVTSGLNPGDTLITSGIMSLRPETSVKIIQLKK